MRLYAQCRKKAAPRSLFVTATYTALALAVTLQSSSARGAWTTITTTMSYPILASGYDGNVQALEFVPPMTLTKGDQTAQNAAGDAPSWITYRTDGSGIAYVTSEDDPGLVHVLSTGIGSQQGLPIPSGVQPALSIHGKKAGYSAGGNGSVASVIVGTNLYIANYDSGSASVLALKDSQHHFEPDMSVKPTVFQFSRKKGTTGPVASRQDQSYAHDAVASPDNAHVYIPDLGADQIHFIKTPSAHDSNKATLAGSMDVAAGSGPRHMVFYESKAGHFAYLTSELANTLTAFKQDRTTGHLHMIGAPVLAVPKGTDLGGNKTAGPDRSVAELAVSPDGHYVYVSDRGDAKEDHIAIFKRDAKTGGVEFLEWVGTQGQNPRHFSMSRDGKYLAVANQNTGNVVIFARDAHTGKLTATGAAATGLGKVAFAGFAPMH